MGNVHLDCLKKRVGMRWIRREGRVNQTWTKKESTQCGLTCLSVSRVPALMLRIGEDELQSRGKWRRRQGLDLENFECLTKYLGLDPVGNGQSLHGIVDWITGAIK